MSSLTRSGNCFYPGPIVPRGPGQQTAIHLHPSFILQVQSFNRQIQESGCLKAKIAVQWITEITKWLDLFWSPSPLYPVKYTFIHYNALGVQIKVGQDEGLFFADPSPSFATNVIYG
jgi:hypothetical protein